MIMRKKVSDVIYQRILVNVVRSVINQSVSLCLSFCLGSGLRAGKILQRFPEKDWPDTPFIDSIELFCQPLGWKLSTDRQEPQFVTSVFTDIDARHHYCACLSFNETVAITPSKPVDDEEEDISDRSSLIASGPAAITHHSVMYAPKCLVIVSKLNYLEVFKVRFGFS